MAMAPALDLSNDQKLDLMSRWMAEILHPIHDIEIQVRDPGPVVPFSLSQRKLHYLACLDGVFERTRAFQRSEGEDWRDQETCVDFLNETAIYISLQMREPSLHRPDDDPMPEWEAELRNEITDFYRCSVRKTGDSHRALIKRVADLSKAREVVTAWRTEAWTRKAMAAVGD